MEPNETAKEFQRLIEAGQLTIEPRAIPIVARCFMVDHEAFVSKIKRMCSNPRDQISLWPDGSIGELSFGIGWYERPVKWEYGDGTKFYGEIDAGAKPFMIGGLIYRGPERGRHPILGADEKHEWTSHT